jgi:hypothetical protein
MSGIVAQIRVEVTAGFADGRVSSRDVKVEVDGGLEARAYLLELLTSSDRMWGCHGLPRRQSSAHRIRPWPDQIVEFAWNANSPQTILGCHVRRCCSLL